MRLLLAVLLSAFSFSSFAIETAYVTFDHPDGWKCELSQGVWICQSTQEPDRKESVILSIATMATEWDTVENYENYLKQPRTIQDEEGNSLTSEVKFARKRNINGVWWVDSLQHNSELPGFWARYAATVQNKLAILITYIVSDEYYQKMAPQFERMIGSLKPKSDFDVSVSTKQGDSPLPGSTKLGQVPTKDLLAKRLNIGRKADKKTETPTAAQPEDTGGDNTMLMVGGGVIIVLLLIVRRKRKSKAAAKKQAVEPTRKAG